MKYFNNSQHTQHQHYIQYQPTVELVASNHLNDRDDERQPDHDHVEHVPQFATEHGEPKGVDFEKDFNDEYGEEPKLIAVRHIEEDEEGVDDDDGIEYEPEPPMPDHCLEYGGGGGLVEDGDISFEYVG